MSCRFYPDTNVIDLIRTTWTAPQFDVLATIGRYTLCLGYQTYELARSFLFNHSQDAPRAAFLFLSQIECMDYLPNVNSIINAELHLAETGMPLVNVVGPFNRVAAKQELFGMSEGSVDEARAFIAKREANVAEDRKRVTALNQAAARRARAIDPKRAAAITSFERLRHELQPGRPGWLGRFVKKGRHHVTGYAIERVLADPPRYPLLNTIVSSQEYLYYITALHRTEPGKDTLDDFRILVESSICDVFVTNDRNLASQSKKIRPFKPAVPWDEFKREFSRK